MVTRTFLWIMSWMNYIIVTLEMISAFFLTAFLKQTTYFFNWKSLSCVQSHGQKNYETWLEYIFEKIKVNIQDLLWINIQHFIKHLCNIFDGHFYEIHFPESNYFSFRERRKRLYVWPDWAGTLHIRWEQVDISSWLWAKFSRSSWHLQILVNNRNSED